MSSQSPDSCSSAPQKAGPALSSNPASLHLENSQFSGSSPDGREFPRNPDSLQTLPRLRRSGAQQGGAQPEVAPPEWKAARRGGAHLVSGSPPWPQYFSGSRPQAAAHLFSISCWECAEAPPGTPDLLGPRVFSPAWGGPGVRSSGTHHPAPRARRREARSGSSQEPAPKGSAPRREQPPPQPSCDPAPGSRRLAGGEEPRSPKWLTCARTRPGEPQFQLHQQKSH